MKRRFELRWYECDLTESRSRKFFTEIGAIVYWWYLERYCLSTAKLYEL